MPSYMGTYMKMSTYTCHKDFVKMRQEGYSQSAYDHSVFTKKAGMDIVIILVYMDNLLITGSTPELIKDDKRTLHDHFKIKDLGDLRYFIGIEVMRFGKNHKLTAVDYNAHVGNKVDPEVEDLVGYQKLIGKLIYLTITRPDICYAIQVLSQFTQRPKQSHLDVAIRVVRYLKGSPGLGLFFPSNTTSELAIYCESDWAICPNTRRSVIGYVVKLVGALLSWKSKKQ
ncbi:uncharacterized mitochondrial protein AtMg00810-like [Solanum dulcamara]|uniref:uncharacterized mitochondrial protein AtMg00810-like n=1 Tax=Solanum dulcamara TaxID=45834 RepID=UPI0024869528|nr:uncharacterized mitochondrial protein AtMg00810-like [Solanum dulcamara]